MLFLDFVLLFKHFVPLFLHFALLFKHLNLVVFGLECFKDSALGLGYDPVEVDDSLDVLGTHRDSVDEAPQLVVFVALGDEVGRKSALIGLVL